MISGMKCSPVAPVTCWNVRPTSAAMSRNSGAGAAAMVKATTVSARETWCLFMACRRSSPFRQGRKVLLDAGQQLGLPASRCLLLRGAGVPQCFTAFAGPCVRGCQRVEVTRRALVLRRQRLQEVLDGFVVFSPVGPQTTQVKMGGPIIRPILDGFLELPHRVVQSALLLGQHAEIVMRVGVVRIDLEGGAKRPLCLLRPTLFEQEHAIVV